MQKTKGQMRQETAMLQLLESEDRVRISWTWTCAAKEQEATRCGVVGEVAALGGCGAESQCAG